jgi:tetratricopeptide (TPR) repeat protein
MSIRKNYFILLFVLVLSARGPTRLWAQSSLFTTVTSEKVAQLETLHQQATDLLLRNDFQAAIRIYSDILLMEPDDETAYTALGQIYLVLGQYKRSHEAFRNALHINPDNQVAANGIQKIMDPDGVEGMITPEEALSEAPAPAPLRRTSVALTPRGPVKSGRTGLLNAQRIQMALKNAGFYHGQVNGLIGGSTKKAVVSFQEEMKLPATGRVTSDTWRVLSAQLSD